MDYFRKFDSFLQASAKASYCVITVVTRSAGEITVSIPSQAVDALKEELANSLEQNTTVMLWDRTSNEEILIPAREVIQIKVQYK